MSNISLAGMMHTFDGDDLGGLDSGGGSGCGRSRGRVAVGVLLLLEEASDNGEL